MIAPALTPNVAKRVGSTSSRVESQSSACFERMTSSRNSVSASSITMSSSTSNSLRTTTAAW